MKRISSSFICCILALLTFLSGCAANTANSEPKGKSYFTYFNTVSYVYSYAGDSAELFDKRSAGVSALLKEYHQLFDIYHEYSGINNLCTVNRLAGGSPVKVDSKLIDFMLYAKELYDTTNGEMNVMMGSVLSLWHECREEASEDKSNARIPSEQSLSEASRHTDFSLLEIDSANCTLRLTDQSASIDVGALGKGYATEKAAEYLKKQGADGYVLNIGGNIRIVGTKPDGSSWITGIRDPYDDTRLSVSMRLSDTACVTSGIYERYYTVNGVRYHHIIDKDTLYPAEYYGSVTIITEDSGLADALSTAFFCMPYEDGSELAAKLDGVEVLWIFPDGDIRYTPGLKDLIES